MAVADDDVLVQASPPQGSRGELVTRKDIETIFAEGLAPLLASSRRIETTLKDLAGRQMTSFEDMLAEVELAPRDGNSEEISPSGVELVEKGDGANGDDASNASKFSSNAGADSAGSKSPHADDSSKPTRGPSNQTDGTASTMTDPKKMSETQPESRHVISVVSPPPKISPRAKSKTGRRSTHVDFIDQLLVKHEMAAMGASGKNAYNARILTKILETSEWWSTIEEPQRSGCCFRITNSKPFGSVVMSLILFNSAFIAYIADYEMKNIGKDTPPMHTYLELIFTSFFFLELLLRLVAHRLFFFVNAECSWNIFDFVLVQLSLLDQGVTLILAESGGGGNVGFMRMLRLLKLAKIFRTFRTMRFFKDLAVMMESFKRSFLSVFWSFCLLGLLLYIFALIFLQGLADYIAIQQTQGSVDAKFEEAAHLHFGSLGSAMLALYMSVTGGNDWAIFYDVVAAAGPLYSFLYLVYTFYFIFCVFNILTGILVEKAVSAAAPTRNDLVLQNRRKSREDEAELWRICMVLDRSHKGTITREDFNVMLENQVFVSYMSSLGLDIHDVERFFSTVAGCEKGGEVSIDRFVKGAISMRGTATSVDMQRQLFETSLLHGEVVKIDKRLDQKTKGIVSTLDKLRGQLLAQQRHIISMQQSEFAPKQSKKNLMSM